MKRSKEKAEPFVMFFKFELLSLYSYSFFWGVLTSSFISSIRESCERAWRCSRLHPGAVDNYDPTPSNQRHGEPPHQRRENELRLSGRSRKRHPPGSTSTSSAGSSLAFLISLSRLPLQGEGVAMPETAQETAHLQKTSGQPVWNQDFNWEGLEFDDRMRLELKHKQKKQDQKGALALPVGRQYHYFARSVV